MARKNKATEMACHGHSDLNVFAAIQAILEGGVIYNTASLRASDQIIAICKREQSRLFKLHERGVEKINEQFGDRPDA
jgi:hypothetical protein